MSDPIECPECREARQRIAELEEAVPAVSRDLVGLLRERDYLRVQLETVELREKSLKVRLADREAELAEARARAEMFQSMFQSQRAMVGHIRGQK